MMNGRRWQPALAILSATAGTGFASGRQLALFFSQTGRAAWAGIALACLVFSILIGLTARAAARYDADSFPELCHRLIGARAARVACAAYALLLTAGFALMLCGAGQVAAIALPLKYAFAWGTVSALMIALMANRTGPCAPAALGLAVLAAGLALYGGLALDGRPVRTYLRGDATLALEDSVPAALGLALAYGAMNAGLAAGMAARYGRRADSAAALGMRCGAMLGALLLCANAAISKGGRVLVAQALPTVILAARWGIAGFWACAAFGYLCAVATLTAALGGLIDLTAGRRRRRARC